jgi:hypothetical protein
MMRCGPLIMSLLMLPIGLHAQHECVFLPMWGSDTLVLRRINRLHSGMEVEVDRLRMYIGVPGAEGLVHHLLDLERPESTRVLFPEDEHRFLLGVDSLTNVSGAFGGDLDPTNGMYWTWQSGYINMKLEGRSSAAPKGRFELHLGGYAAPHATAQWVHPHVLKGGDAHCVFDVQRLMEAVDLNAHAEVMSPGPEAVRLSRAAAAMFLPHAP